MLFILIKYPRCLGGVWIYCWQGLKFGLVGQEEPVGRVLGWKMLNISMGVNIDIFKKRLLLSPVLTYKNCYLET